MPCVYLCNCKVLKEIWISDKQVDEDTGEVVDMGHYTKILARKDKDIDRDKFECLICGVISFKSIEAKEANV